MSVNLYYVGQLLLRLRESLLTMSSKKTLALRVKDTKKQIEVSIEQIQSYREQKNILDQTSVNQIISDLSTINVIELQGVCENTINIVREISVLATKEIQRRGLN